MKNLLLFIGALFLSSALFAQKDTAIISANRDNKFQETDNSISVSIFPVPVKDGQFTIKTDRDISALRITNIIGQEIFKTVYNNPEKEVKVNLNNAGRGIYIIMITFSDNTRVVKKISSEGSSF
ncbi:MAG: T9SS type A sorting domain-containing protein [Bacteroidales bacterium]